MVYRVFGREVPSDDTPQAMADQAIQTRPPLAFRPSKSRQDSLTGAA